MPDNLVGEIRRSAVLMTHAPGSIMDLRSGSGPVSGVHAGLEEWDQSAPLKFNLRRQKFVERRLCKKLGKKYFRLPPVLEDGAKIPNSDRADESALVVRRFPHWLQCPKCETVKRSKKWNFDPGSAARYCIGCSGSQRGKKVYVVPVRFAVACTNGHLDEFPWHFWIRHKDTCENKEEYRIFSVNPGLAGLWVKCLSCESSRSFDGAFGQSALAGLTCLGKRPWLRTDDESCSCNGIAGTYRVVQRGASNLYYPVIDSALAIPPWSDYITAMLGDEWSSLEGIEDRDQRITYCANNYNLKQIVKDEGKDAEWLVDRFDEARSRIEAADVSNLRPDEYSVFVSDIPRHDPEFEIYPEKISGSLLPYVDTVVRVARLEEARVLRGFTRIHPPTNDEADVIAPLSAEELDWLPGIRVRGEGIFIGLNRKSLLIWESTASVQERCRPVVDSWNADWLARNPGKNPPHLVTPRLLLIHTLAHALIKQLTYECGYSAASLRERLYVSEGELGMAGLLIYTATPDSDGTLGGLQRRANPDLLEGSLKAALSSFDWCSADPLCINGDMAANESHSLASCHSCVMLPETCCEHFNQFLDRGLVRPEQSESGGVSFFKGIL